MEQAAKQKEATDAYLSQLMPPMLYSRVLSRERYEDSGSSVSVLIASVSDLAMWVPVTAGHAGVEDAVDRVGRFMAGCEIAHIQASVERIRVTGDEFLATSNLIVPTLCHAVRIASFACDVRGLVHDNHLPVRCAVHTGALRGFVTGTRFLRYDVCGEGIDVTRQLLRCCCEGEVVVSSATQQLLRDRATFAPCSVFPFTMPRSGAETIAAFVLQDMVSLRLVPPQEEVENKEPANELPRPRQRRVIAPVMCEQTNEAVESPNASADTKRVKFDDSGSSADTESDVRPLRLKDLYSRHRSTRVFGDDVESTRKYEMTSTEDATDSAPLSPLSSACQGYSLVGTWWSTRFANAQFEAEYIPNVRSVSVMIGTSALAFGTFVVLVVLCVENRGLPPSGVATVGFCIIALGSVTSIGTIAWWVRIRLQGRRVGRPTEFSTFISNTVVCLAVSTGLALTRPSFVANDSTYFFVGIACSFTINVSGLPWRKCVGLSVLELFGNGSVLMAVHHCIVKTVSILTAVCVFCLVVVFLRWQEVSARHRHRDLQLVRISSQIEEAEKEKLQSALTATIPAPLVRAVLSLWKDGKCALVHRVAHGVVVKLHYHAGASTAAEGNSSTGCEGEIVPSTASAEALLKTFRYLTLTKVVGDTVLAAGPVGGSESEYQGATAEAKALVDSARGSCDGAASAVGEFYAVVTCRAFASFFLLGDAVHRVDAQAPLPCVLSSEMGS